jgi:hypothetical protein
VGWICRSVWSITGMSRGHWGLLFPINDEAGCLL